MSRSLRFARWLHDEGLLDEKPTKKLIQRYRDETLPPAARPPEPAEWAEMAIIVDIDGTLAHMHLRSPYDTSRYSEDQVDEVVRDLVRTYKNVYGDKIIVVSGRSDEFRGVTTKWLEDHGVPYDTIIMRPASDPYSPDDEVKARLYKQYIAPLYNVRFVLDDRDRVVDMWRGLGIKVLQVGDGDF